MKNYAINIINKTVLILSKKKYRKLYIFSSIITVIIIFAINKINNQNIISDNIKKELQKTNWKKLNFAQTTTSDFDSVCIFGPYSSNESVAKILGFNWNIELRTSIHLDDGHNVIVYIEDNQVIQYVKHPRNLGDFATLSNTCFKRYNSTIIPLSTKKGYPQKWLHLDNFTSQTNKSNQEIKQ